jgi:flagellar motor switch protein FliM
VSELLTQKEIDELLAAIQDGNASEIIDKEEKKEKIRIYDFKTAKRVPRDQIKTLHVVYESFTRLLATYLNGALGVLCDATVTSIEEQTYMEFTNAVSSTSVLAILKMPPLVGPLLLRLSPEISYSIIECLLGGMNSPSDKRRVFTEIDLVILEKIIRQILLLNNDAWQKVLKVNATLDGIETSIQFAQIVPPSDTILIITINVTVADSEALINLCIPYTAIEPISKSLNARLLNATSHEKIQYDEYTELILKNIETTPVVMKASLSETTISMEDLMNLQINDVIQLDHRLDEPIKLDIGHIPRLKGVLGVKNKHYAIRLTQINEEEDRQYE